MYTDQKPLFTLSIAEFAALIKSLVEKAIDEKEQEKTKKGEAGTEESVFNIEELRKFLRCSKASIHNYKHLGLPFYRVGRTILFKKSEVLAFMKTLKGKNYIV